jgi:hypothetical protein
MINILVIGCGQRIVWVAAQAIRATSLLSDVLACFEPDNTPDNATFPLDAMDVCRWSLISHYSMRLCKLAMGRFDWPANPTCRMTQVTAISVPCR